MTTRYLGHKITYLRSLSLWAVSGPSDASEYLFRTLSLAVEAINALRSAES